LITVSQADTTENETGERSCLDRKENAMMNDLSLVYDRVLVTRSSHGHLSHDLMKFINGKRNVANKKSTFCHVYAGIQSNCYTLLRRPLVGYVVAIFLSTCVFCPAFSSVNGRVYTNCAIQWLWYAIKNPLTHSLTHSLAEPVINTAADCATTVKSIVHWIVHWLW